MAEMKQYYVTKPDGTRLVATTTQSLEQVKAAHPGCEVTEKLGLWGWLKKHWRFEVRG